jgi:ribonuclease P protein component
VGGAVVRNRIKRRLRHAVAPFVGDLEAGVVVVLQGSLSARTEPFEALQAEILDGLRRTGAVRG